MSIEQAEQQQAPNDSTKNAVAPQYLTQHNSRGELISSAILTPSEVPGTPSYARAMEQMHTGSAPQSNPVMSLTRTKTEESALSQYASAREGIHFDHADAVVSDQQLDTEFDKMKRRQRREARRSEQQTREKPKSMSQHQGPSRVTAPIPLHPLSSIGPDQTASAPQATKKNMLQDIMQRI